MERLTFDGEFCDISMCREELGGPFCEEGYCSQRRVWERLKSIEDILGGDYNLDRLRELVQADREGRCAILSAPMKPMVQKPNDTDVYCPRCGETLSGGWPCPEYEDYRKMCQCPNCGESIDDNKVELQEAALKGEQNG